MNFAKVAVVYRKELLDALRDKRTLFATIILPMLMLPVITLGFGSVATHSVKKVQQETFSIVVLGGENSPALLKALSETPAVKFDSNTNAFAERISNKRLRAALEIPPDFEARLNAREEPPPIKIYHYAGEMRSQFAVRTIQNGLRKFSDGLVEKRLSEANLSTAVLRPFKTEEQNVAPPEKVGGNLLGGLIPYMIIFLSFVGAMGPAIDLTAGEKERGTIETILASPVGRMDLVMGKFLMVLTASLVTTLMSLTSFALTFTLPLGVFMQVSKLSGMGFQISPANMAAVFVLIFPLATMFSASLLALALFARTFKEAQSYLSPLMMLIILPAMASMLPGTEPTALLSLVPVLNVSLISKDVLGGHYDWNLVLVVFSSTCIYAAAALGFAVYMFNRESVLFRT